MSPAAMQPIWTYPVGTRVRTTREIDIFDIGILPAGLTGVLVETSAYDPRATVKLDSVIPELAEWGGELQVFEDVTVSDSTTDAFAVEA